MKKLLIIFSFTLVSNAFGQINSANFITSDIDNFWTAYDKITATKDSVQQYAFLKELYLDKGTIGLKAMMEARRTTAKTYINAINKHPLFWASVRANTLKAPIFAEEIAANVLKMKLLYPELKPAKIYFTIGAFRSNGTTMDSLVLIGSELALADKNTVTTELSPQFSHLQSYFDGNPIDKTVFLNVHEYVHTQQKTTIGNYLLAQCLIEGVAEFMAEKTTGKLSVEPAMAYGKSNEENLKPLFGKDFFLVDNYNDWLWNSFDNGFKMRDLGYFMGHAICEKYYNAAKDKSLAIREMIELDYNNEAALGQFIDKSAYFSKPFKAYRTAFDALRPTVVGIKQFRNGDKNVDANTTQLTIEFSGEMDKEYTGFDFGPLGEKNALTVKKMIGFSKDKKSVSFEVELKPNQHYQLQLTAQFLTERGVPLMPFLIDFTTK
jgi:hypothetical protein